MRHRLHPSRGTSVVELMVGMLIGLIVLGIALQLVLVARARYQRIADDALIEDRGTQALELLTTAVQHAGWIADTPAASPVRRWPDVDESPSLQGVDDCRAAASTTIDGIQCAAGKAIRNSDAMLVRFAGRSNETDGLHPDDSMIDCSGYGVPERFQDGDDNPRTGVILLFVTESNDGEPELICRSPTHPKGQITRLLNAGSPGMVRGVETLQLLYLVGAADGKSAKTMSAREMDSTQWRRVKAVHIALVVRGEYIDPKAIGKQAPTLALFSNLSDVGNAKSQDLHFTPTETQRRRTVFTATVRLRNALACEADAC